MSDSPYPVGFHFRVEFPNLITGPSDTRFQEVSGIGMELSVEEFSEGGENRFTHRLPTPPKYSNLILRRGLTVNSSLIKWCKLAIEEFQFYPSEVFVSLLNENHEPLAHSYNFNNAWPIKWSVSNFNAQENALVIESIELSYDKMNMITI